MFKNTVSAGLTPNHIGATQTLLVSVLSAGPVA